MGAYLGLVTPGVPILGAFMFNSIYKFPAYRFACTNVFTNKTWTDAYRGAGRPEATFAIERMMDELAVELGRDPLEVREQNWIKHEEFPFTTVCRARVRLRQLRGGDREGPRAVRLRRPARRAGRSAVSAGTRCSWASASRRSPRCAGWRRRGCSGRWATSPAAGSRRRSGCCRPARSRCVTGASAHGQGHETAWSQIVADRLGVAVRGRRGAARRHPDLAQGPGHLRLALARGRRHRGGQGGRQGDREGQADRGAPARGQRRRPGVRAAAGSRVRGTDQGVGMADLAFAVFPRHNLPDGVEPTLDSEATFDPENFSFPHGTHLCATEVDTETGGVTIRSLRLRRRHRRGHQPADRRGAGARRPRPGHRAGAVRGGGARRPGHADDGDVRRLPAARPRADLPHFTTDRTTTPSTTNPLGVKGVGEAGTIASTPAVVNAVLDAVRHLGVKDIEMPLSPQRVWRAVRDGARRPARARRPRPAALGGRPVRRGRVESGADARGDARAAHPERFDGSDTEGSQA